MIRGHHERYDGHTTGPYPGHPDGLCGDRIPLAARILHVAETAEGLLAGRPYKPPRSLNQVTRLLREEAGKSFDPNLIQILLVDQDWDKYFDYSEKNSSPIHDEMFLGRFLS